MPSPDTSKQVQAGAGARLGIDRARAERLLRQAGLDGLALFQPEHLAWATGLNVGVAGLFRRAGAGAALVPADPSLTLAAVLPDLVETATRGVGAHGVEIRYHPIWVDTAVAPPHQSESPLADLLGNQPAGARRPATFDPRACFLILREQLQERSLAKARLGVDLSFVSVADFALLRECLPDATLVDATEAINRLKMVKTLAEVAHLRAAVELSEIGLSAALSAIRPGVVQAELGLVYSDAVRAAALAHGLVAKPVADYIAVGPRPWGPGRPAAPGDIIKFDLAVLIAGYSSDMARTFSLGRAVRAARELHAALLSGLEAGLERLRPGVPLRDIHATMQATVRAAGIPGYMRGHFGHGLGNEFFGEQWPFIAADCEVAAEPGMVLAVEAPLYVDGLGGFIVEDQVLVTEAGIEVMSRSERGLREVG